MRFIVALFFIMLLLPQHLVFSQQKIVEGDSVRYEFAPLVVTGSRYTMPKNNVASSINVISEMTLRQTNLTTVAEAVSKFTPGAFTTQRAVMGYGVSTGAAGSISLRGMSGSPNTQVLILIDGRPDFNGIFGHPLPDAYPLDYVERVEVLRGPAAAVYGTNAMAGVVNIITRDVKTPGFSTLLSTSAGSYGTQSYLVQHGGLLNRFSYQATASYNKSDGHRDNSQFEGQSYSLKLGYQFNPNFKLRLFGSTTPYEFHDPGPEGGQPEFEFGEIIRHTVDLTLENAFSKTNGSLKIHGNFGEHDLSDGWYSKDRTVGLVLFQNIDLPKEFTATVGLDAKQYGGEGKLENASAFMKSTLGEEYITEVAGYTNLQKVFLKKLILGAGLRVENNSVFGNVLLPKFGLVIHPDLNTGIRFSAAKGFRSPTARELFFFPSRNDELQPEELWSYEVGVSRYFSELLSVEIDAFVIDATDLIRVSYATMPARTINVGSLKYNGVEFTLKSKPVKNLSAQLTYAYFNTDEILPFAPNKLSAWFAYRWRALSLAASAESVAKLYSDTNEASRLEDYTTFGVNIQYEILKSLRLALNIENLANTDYEILQNYPMPGRTLIGKLVYEF
jgi:iron complex outermembrane receptor protein